MQKMIIMLAVALWMTDHATAAEIGLKPIRLPAVETEKGKPLMRALKERKTTREFQPKTLSERHLGDLLWSAFGINRPDGHRTAPSAMNAQEMDLYVATDEGLYLYDAKEHTLMPQIAGDLRAKINGQEFVKVAPVMLIYVADFARMTKARPEEKDFYSGADSGFISQNVYLYCASENLATVVYALGNRNGIAQTMKLRPDQKPVLGQSVGYPKAP